MQYQRRDTTSSSMGKPLRVVLHFNNIQINLTREPESYDELIAKIIMEIPKLGREHITIRTQGGDLVTSTEELQLTIKAARSLGQGIVNLILTSGEPDDFPEEHSVSEILLLESGRQSESKDALVSDSRREHYESQKNSNPEFDEPQGSQFGKDVDMKGAEPAAEESSSSDSDDEEHEEVKHPEGNEHGKEHEERHYRKKWHRGHHHHCGGKKRFGKMMRHVRSLIDEFAPQAYEAVRSSLNEAPASTTDPVHENFVCDGCEMNPIVGVRYQCSVCSNYDLCEKCEAKDVHQQHPLVKIKNPSQAPKFVQAEINQEPQQQQQNWWGAPQGHDFGQQQQGWGFPGFGGWGRGGAGGWGRGGPGGWGRGGPGGWGRGWRQGPPRGGCGFGSRPEEWRPFINNMAEKFAPMAEKFAPLVKEFLGKVKDHHHHGHHHHGDEENSKYPKMMVPVTKKEKVFCAPGQIIIQNIKIENRSPLDWPPAVILKPLYNGEVKIDSQIQIPTELRAGETGELVIPLQAPEKSGKYKVVFGLFAPNEERVGKRIVIKLIVMDEQAELDQKQKADMMKQAAELSKEGHNFWKAYQALKEAGGNREKALASLKGGKEE